MVVGNKWVKTFNTVLLLVFFTIIALTVLYPLVYVVVGAFTPGNSIAGMDVIPFASGFTLDHFVYLFTRSEYPHWFANTLFIAVLTCAGTLFVASISAYVFSRFRFTFKKPMLMSLLILQIFPSFVGMIAIYVILYRIGGLNTHWGLILVYLAGNTPYNIWLVKSYMDSIPKSLDEAARIDGASHFKVYRSIILPIAKPILVFLTITSFVGPWMDYIFPKMVLRDPSMQTLALGLFSFVTERNNDFTNFAAGALLIAIPFVIFFTITQKMLVTSLGGAAVKE
ncbi:MAG: sugar ABC transporter permease [Clostridiales bacterium]|jgi:arabinogalactan oligomer/maltooligosaccharide transport system permease protein|nr:sugar ABC transporter permease [Clostridiales bacterium]